MFVLDEIDRLDDDDAGVRAALLEAVARAPGAAFPDPYLDLPLDLSDAVFVATANSLGAVPRMWRERTARTRTVSKGCTGRGSRRGFSWAQTSVTVWSGWSGRRRWRAT